MPFVYELGFDVFSSNALEVFFWFDGFLQPLQIDHDSITEFVNHFSPFYPLPNPMAQAVPKKADRWCTLDERYQLAMAILEHAGPAPDFKINLPRGLGKRLAEKFNVSDARMSALKKNRQELLSIKSKWETAKPEERSQTRSSYQRFPLVEEALFSWVSACMQNPVRLNLHLVHRYVKWYFPYMHPD